MRDFFRQTLATLVGLVIFVTLGITGFIALLFVLSIASTDTGPSVEDKSILAFDLSVPITDAVPESDPGALLTGALTGQVVPRSLSLNAAINAIEKAAEDERITGLYINGNVSPVSTIGLAGLGELREALEAFRKSGKPIIAYEAMWTERDYYLASVANTLVMNPSGVLELNGLSSERSFFAEALQKYGVGVQTSRVGRYKSAVESFTRTSRSPEEREQTQKLLGDLWGEFRASVAKSRNVTPQTLQQVVDTKALLLAEDARTAKLADRVAYFDELLPDLWKLTGETAETREDEEFDQPNFRQIAIADYAEAVETEEPFGDNEVALVYAEGDIVSGEGGSGQIGGDRFAELLQELRDDEDVKAVVLRVNSPGGSAMASEQVARQVKLTQAKKPVIISMGNLAASGGYQIASYGEMIFASPTTITGSIGVFGLLVNVQDLANNVGVTWDVVKTGKYADSIGISRPKTPEELAILQRITDQFYDRFLTIVSEGRSLPKDQVNEIGQGRVWSGLEAKRIGLVDELGGLDDAIAAAVKSAELGDDWQVVEYPKSGHVREQLLRTLLGAQFVKQTVALDPLTVELQKLQADLKTLRSLNDPAGVYSRIPFNPWID